MKKISIFITILIFLFTATAMAEVVIKADVDKKTLTTDELLTYKIVITSSDSNVPKPEVPKFEGFNLISQAQSSTVSFGQGNIKTIIVYAFILAPTDIGKFKIAPASLKIKDKTYSTDAFEIEVSKGTAQPKPKPEQKPPLPKRTLPETEKGQEEVTL